MYKKVHIDFAEDPQDAAAAQGCIAALSASCATQADPMRVEASAVTWDRLARAQALGSFATLVKDT